MALLPDSQLSVDTFERLKPLGHLLRFIPTGAGKEGKAPLISAWSLHNGFTVQELQEQFPEAKSVGVITQPLLCFDFDGETATQHAVLNDRDPDYVNTWRINRTTDPHRYKLLFLPSKEQLAQLPNGQITHSFKTRPASSVRHPYEKGAVVSKGEAEEIFCHPGRQVIVAGAHPSSVGHYFWPVGFGPEALSAPPEEWWEHVLELSRDYPRPAAGTNKTVSTSRFASRDWQRIEHCPVCGRGPDDNPLCQLHRDGETLRCFLGQTFSPPTNLEPGELVPGTDWTFSRVSSSGWGEFLTFVKDKPNRYQQVKAICRVTPMATYLVLADQLPPGWLDDNEEDRYRLEVGDLVTLLSGPLRKRWRFNLMTEKIELDGKPIPVFELENLYCHLSQRGYTIDKNKAIDAAKAAAMAHSFHPVREYLERVASDDSIVAADLDQIATVFWDTNDPLYDAMLRKTLIGAVKRIYEPGCMFRTCLVFKGGQDIRKSSSFKYMASPDWVTDTAQDKHEDFLLALHGCWFYELAESDSITNKKDAGALKNDLSYPKDDIRVPYGRAHDTFRRQSICVGTSNRDDFLCDETGASRFWVVDLPHDAEDGFVIDTNRIRDNRDAIFKAAVLAYRAGEQPVLSLEHQNESNRRNLGFERNHPWEDYLADLLHNLPPHIKSFSAEAALNMSGAMGTPPVGWDYAYSALQYKDSVEVGKILRRLGCTQDKHPVRKNGKRRRWWHPPDTSDTGVSSNRVPALTAAVATDSSDLAHGTSGSSLKDSPPINTPIEAAALMGKTLVPSVPEEDSQLFLAEDDFNNVAMGSAWDV